MRFPGDAILNLFRTLPQNTPIAQSASALDAPMQKESRRLEFDSSTFAFWKMIFGSKVCSGSCRSSFAMIWIGGVDSSKSMKYLRTSRSFLGNYLPNFETLDAKIANRKKTFIEEQMAQSENRFLRGRQIAFMSFDFFRITSAGESFLDFSDLMGISLRGDNVQGFDTK